MLSKTLVGLATLALAQEALAGSAHRHGFQHLHKRGSTLTEVEVVTDVVTTTVWIGGEPTPTSTAKAKAFYTASRRRSSKASSHISTAASTSTSSSTSTTPSTTSTSTSVPEPVVAPTTTLVTEAKVAAIETTAAVTPVTSVPVPVDIVASVTAAVAAVTSAAAAAVSSAVSSTTSSDKKRGLAYNDHSLLSGFLGSSSKVSWKYNWGQSDDGGSTGIEFVPMLWGTGPNHEPTWSANAEKAISAGSSHFLSFNECDNAGQANMSPATAAAAHIRLMNPYSGRVKIGSPAITNSNNAGEGIDWLKSFFTACNGQCDVDFVAVHWYNSPDTTEFLQHLVNVHNAVNLPIWITEFAPSGSDSQINSFLTTVMAELDSNPTYSFVERYSYFMVSANSLISSGTTLSTFGQTFAFA